MSEYSECQECGFVLKSRDLSNPRPKNWERCPDCDSDEFRFPDEGPVQF